MTNKTPYSFHPDLVLRTPRLPLPGEMTAQTIPVLLSDPIFLESLYIASPVVYDECIKWKQGDINPKKIEKLTATITKYYLRSSSRCTPFGLFSGCSFISWQNNPTAIMLDEDSINRNVRLDMYYLCLLAQKITNAPGITELLTYYTNNSAYKIGDELRYVEYLFIDGAKKYQITAIQQNEYLNKIITAASNGKKISELIALIVDEDISEEEAKSFVYDLIDAQVITSELEPKLTGNGLLDQIITTLEKIVTLQQSAIQHVLEVLKNVQQQLKNIASLQTDRVAAYREIVTILNEAEPVLDESKIFQMDSSRAIKSGGVAIALQDQLQDVLSVLNKLSTFHKNKNLKSFSKNFYDKYGDEEMPLLRVLDTETGIGYLNNEEGYLTPLIDNLIIPSKEQTPDLTWGKIEQFLHKKLSSKNNNCIEITDEDLKEFGVDWKAMPETMSVLFKLIDSNTNQIQVDAVGGATAAGLLGRFAHTDQRINSMLYTIAEREQQNNTAAVYAEIIHLPENRVGNVLLRPGFRGYEIPYLAQSSVAIDQQIAVSDLYVSVKNGAVFLRSKKIDKQIIPRLSTAHNFDFNALPVYQFLCDLQTQDIQDSLTFSWSSINYLYTALPRVMYKNTILSLAKWNFTDLDIKQLVKNDAANMMEGIQHFKQAHQLPDHVVLTDGDNELLVNLNDKLSVTVWLNTIRKRSSFILKEFIYPVSAVIDKQQHVYSNQFIATLFKEIPVAKPARVYKATDIDTTITRSFSLGSEWTYYKLYCGVKTADKILAEAIKPLADELLSHGLIDQYFFIRYYDPEFHIRLRFHLIDTERIGTVISLVNNYLQPFLENGFIWKEQVESYTRELERYGSNAIEIAESFFYYDSVTLLEMLALTEGDAREEIRWIWAIRAIDELLNSFNFSLQQKSAVMTVLKEFSAAEFAVDKPLTLQLNDRYREHKQTIEQIMNEGHETKTEVFPLIEILYKKKTSCSALAEEIIKLDKNKDLAVPLNSFISSLIHMMVNRIIKADPRLHEMVIYNFTSRYYQSAIIKMGIDQTV